MRYYKYLNESRSQELTKDQFEILLHQNCSNIINVYNKQSRRIFRGLSSSFKYISIDPTKSIRISANTLNYYTLLFDEILSSWKGWPKRSKSIICTTHTSKAMGYGKIYKVYPYNNAHIGVCPRADIWESFPLYLDEFNSLIDEISYKINYDLFETKESLEQFIENVSDYYKDQLNINSNFIEKYFKSEKSFYNYLNSYFDPKKNGFIKGTPSNIKLDSNKEVWIEGECLMEML